MDFEKTIMDLVKKYIEKEKQEKEAEVAQNADFEEKKVENEAQNEQIEQKIETEEDAKETAQEQKEEQAEAEKIQSFATAQEEVEQKQTDLDEIKNATPTTFSELDEYLEKVEKMFPEVTAEEITPSHIELERKEMPNTTEEEIVAEVESLYAPQKEQDANAINIKYDDKAEDAEAQKKTITNKTSEQSDQINMVYNSERVSAENNALKRGLARSSIVCLALEDIEKERAQKLSALGKTLSDKLDEIEQNLASLEKERQQALDALDVSYAIKIGNQIDKKLQELKKQQDAVVEYNNKITQAEQKYNLSIDEKLEKQKANAQKEADQKNAEIKRQKQNEQIALITKYFAQFPTQKAIAELQKHTEIATKYGVDVYYRVYRNIISEK